MLLVFTESSPPAVSPATPNSLLSLLFLNHYVLAFAFYSPCCASPFLESIFHRSLFFVCESIICALEPEQSLFLAVFAPFGPHSPSVSNGEIAT